MKTRLTIALLAIALVTLSFTFVSRIEKTNQASNKNVSSTVNEAPIGGFALENK